MGDLIDDAGRAEDRQGLDARGLARNAPDPGLRRAACLGCGSVALVALVALAIHAVRWIAYSD